MTNLAKYDAQYLVPSASGGKPHKVSHYPDDTWACDCWPWRKTREDCNHIRAARDDGDGKLVYGTPRGEAPKPDPVYHLALVEEVHWMTEQPDELLVPLCPLGDIDFAATILYDLHTHGMSWRAITEHWGKTLFGKPPTLAQIQRHILDFGRKVSKFHYTDPEHPEKITFTEYVHVPVSEVR